MADDKSKDAKQSDKVCNIKFDTKNLNDSSQQSNDKDIKSNIIENANDEFVIRNNLKNTDCETEVKSSENKMSEKSVIDTKVRKGSSMENMELKGTKKLQELSDSSLADMESPAVITKDVFPMTKFQILKNLAVVSAGFFCLFTAFISISNLQTSLNIDNGVGPGSLSVIYGALVLSCMFLPPIVIAHLGCKWTIAISMTGYILYMGANMHAVWPLMAPAAVLLGLGAAPLWSAKCTYLTQTGVWYAKMTNQSKDAVINRFFGIFFMLFQASQISGNLVSSLVFSQNNTELNLTDEMLQGCGANFDPTKTYNNTNLNRPNQSKVYIVCGVYLGFAVLAAIIVGVFLDKLPLAKGKSRKPSIGLLIGTFRHLATSPAQILLIPLTMYSGVEQAFFSGDFTRSYVTCSIGIWNVGYIAISYGVVDAICSYTFGRLVQYVGHIPFFVLAFILHGGVQVTLLLWLPDPNMVYIYYILAALWGMGDAVIQTQINALYGLLFTENTEAAFANYRLWESAGFIFAFAYNDYIATYIKLYVCMAVLTIGMAGYTAVEVLQRSKTATSYDIAK